MISASKYFNYSVNYNDLKSGDLDYDNCTQLHSFVTLLTKHYRRGEK